MKLEVISEHQKVDEKMKEITISNHGIIYKITSDFHGIRIENDHPKGIATFASDNKNQIVIR